MVFGENFLPGQKKCHMLGKEDGGGVNGSHTDLLPGPLWKYNSVVEKPPEQITSDIQNQLLHNRSSKDCGGDSRGLARPPRAAAPVG